MSTITQDPVLTAQQCPICLRIKYFFPEEEFESKWLSELPPDAAAIIDKKYTTMVCDNKDCIKKSKEIADKLNEPLTDGVEQIGRVVLIPHKQIRPFADQPRKYFDQDVLHDLKESIAEFGQIVPVFVKEIPKETGSEHVYELVDGQCRWHAVDMAGIKKMKAIILSVKDIEEQFLIAVISNFGKMAHSDMDIAFAIERFEKNGKSIDQIRKIFGMSKPWVYNHRKLLRLAPKVQGMMSLKIPEEKRLIYASALLITDFSHDKQLEIAPKITGNELKQIQVKAIVRKEADKAGIVIGDPDRAPNKDYNVLWSFIFRIEAEMGVTLKHPQTFFDKMFANRSNDDHDRTLLKIDDCIAELQMLRKSVHKARKKE